MAKSNGAIGDWLDRLEAVIEKRDRQYAERQQQFEKRQEQFEKRQERFEKSQQRAEQRLQRLESMVAGLIESQNLIYDLQAANERRFEELKEQQAERDAMVDAKFAELAVAQAITQNNLAALIAAFNDHVRDPQAHQPGNGKNGGGRKKKSGRKS